MKTLVIGITGSFGTGKSTVARMFKKLGAYVIDADAIAHDVIAPGGACYRRVVSLFGKGVLKKDRTIDRKRLGEIVFNNRKRLLLLNSVIHPGVIKRIKGILRKKGNAVYVVDAPLLIEAGLHNTVDKLILVTASPTTQKARCMNKFGMKIDEVLKIKRSQMALAEKRPLADFIIDNNGPLGRTKKRVKEIWREIRDGKRR